MLFRVSKRRFVFEETSIVSNLMDSTHHFHFDETSFMETMTPNSTFLNCVVNLHRLASRVIMANLQLQYINVERDRTSLNHSS